MAVLRMDNLGIVVEDMPAAIAFFLEFGLSLEGEMDISESWAGQVVGLDGMRSQIAMLATPDGHGRIELAKYHHPESVKRESPIEVNTQGLHRAMFAVDDLEDTLNRLKPHGGELIGEVVNYNDVYLLCYIRGPEGIVIGLAEPLT